VVFGTRRHPKPTGHQSNLDCLLGRIEILNQLTDPLFQGGRFSRVENLFELLDRDRLGGSKQDGEKLRTQFVFEHARIRMSSNIPF
jgi:hypothetical protein